MLGSLAFGGNISFHDAPRHLSCWLVTVHGWVHVCRTVAAIFMPVILNDMVQRGICGCCFSGEEEFLWSME